MTLELEQRWSCCNKCCCLPHCLVENHHTKLWKKATQFTNPFPSCYMMTTEETNINYATSSDNTTSTSCADDEITNLLFSVNRDFLES